MSSRKRHAKTRKKQPRFKLEPLMKGIHEALIHDLSDAHMRKGLASSERGKDFQVNDGCPPYTFKKLKQVFDFDKRIIWPSDKDSTLLEKEALAEFKESQKSFLMPEPMSRRAMLVTCQAKEIIREILGTFSVDAWFDSCSFGKRAAVGLPRRKSYLDERFNALSGTTLQNVAFNACLSRDIHLLRGVRKRSRIKNRRDVNAIKATAVPKSWKAARIIAPDTILGGFLSRGLGDYIRERLEGNTHIDLAKQQERHRRWAQIASKNGYLSTIDMSKASDSFTWRHIEVLMPEDWHAALKCVQCSHCDVDGDVIGLKSYMLMGAGHTFPLQTLLFYALAEATRTLMKVRGKVSVYGDDIIIPTRIASQFITIMTELGFSINSEKSFFDGPDPELPHFPFFRESCGGDYKGGVDVRPYMPECNLQLSAHVPRNEYTAWCHKLINGLLDRWSVHEIETTVRFILLSIHKCGSKICLVPKWETSHAGIRHTLPDHTTFGHDTETIKYVSCHPSYWRLVYTRQKRRRSVFERPYVWYAYWLQRNVEDGGQSPKTQQGHDKYSPPTSLSGEDRKDKDGIYRWRLFGPGKSGK